MFGAKSKGAMFLGNYSTANIMMEHSYNLMLEIGIGSTVLVQKPGAHAYCTAAVASLGR